MNAPTIFPKTSGIVDAQSLALHVYSRVPMSMEADTEAHSTVDNMPGENGLEAWNRLAQRFDPASTQAHR